MPSYGYQAGSLARTVPRSIGSFAGQMAALPGQAYDYATETLPNQIGGAAGGVMNDAMAGYYGIPQAPQVPPIEAAIASRGVMGPPAPPPGTPPEVRSLGLTGGDETPAIEQSIAARSGPAPNSLQAGQFSTPDWTNVGSGPRTAGQIEQDIQARGLLEADNAQVMSGIEAALARRGDPMQKAIEARGQTLQYERSLPYGSQSRVQASMGDMEVGGNYGDGEFLGGPTTGESIDFERKLAIQSHGQPKERLAIEEAVARRAEISKLQALAMENAKRVAAFKAGDTRNGIPQEAADAEMHRAMVIAAQKGALNEGDFAAMGKLLFPDAENVPGSPMGVGGIERKP